MPAQPDAHPSTDVLRKFSLGKLAGESSATIQSHLEKCDTCREQVASLSGDSATGRGLLRYDQCPRAAAGTGEPPRPSSRTTSYCGWFARLNAAARKSSEYFSVNRKRFCRAKSTSKFPGPKAS